MTRHILLILAATALPLKAHAYFSQLNTGHVIKQGEYRLSLSPQFITSSELGEGANFTGRFDMGLNEDSDLRFEIGTGRVDFHLAGFWKWVPVPDTPDQPAIGVIGGGYWARQNSVGTVSVRAFPFISKRFDTRAGIFDPYASLPLGVSSTSTVTEFPIQIAFGTEWMPPGLDRISFWFEMGFNVSKAFSYMSLMASLYWDDQKGIEFH